MLKVRLETDCQMGRRGCSQMCFSQSILQRDEMRQFSGICQYPAKVHGFTVNQGGTADKLIRP